VCFLWWALAQISPERLIYRAKGRALLTYAARRTLSSHDVALGYEDVVETSVYLKARCTPARSGDGVADDTMDAPPEVRVRRLTTASYARVQEGTGWLVLAAGSRRDRRAGESSEILERVSARSCLERYGSYRGPIFAAEDREERRPSNLTTRSDHPGKAPA